MPQYSFNCKACEKPREFSLKMDETPKVGQSMKATDEMCPDEDVECTCGANNWTRTWGSGGIFRMHNRRKPIWNG